MDISSHKVDKVATHDAGKKRPRILIVEDEDMLRGTVSRYLRKQGYEVWSVTNGFEALVMLQYHKPSLVISDIRMPKLGGLTMVEGMRNRPETKDVPVMFITAYREEDYYNRAKELGAVYLLLKPFTLSELRDKIDAAIGHKKRNKVKDAGERGRPRAV